MAIRVLHSLSPSPHNMELVVRLTFLSVMYFHVMTWIYVSSFRLRDHLTYPGFVNVFFLFSTWLKTCMFILWVMDVFYRFSGELDLKFVCVFEKSLIWTHAFLLIIEDQNFEWLNLWEVSYMMYMPKRMCCLWSALNCRVIEDITSNVKFFMRFSVSSIF